MGSVLAQTTEPDAITRLIAEAQQACSRGNHKKEQELYEQALPLALSQQRPQDIDSILDNLGHAYMHSSAFSQAIATFEKALSSAQKHGNNALAVFVRIELCICHHSLGEPARARNYLQQAQQQKGSLSLWDQGNAALGIAFAYNRLEEGERALASMAEAIACFRRGKHPESEVVAHIHLADLASGFGYFPQALQHYQTAFRLAQAIGMGSQAVHCLTQTGHFYLQQGKREEALHYFGQAVATAESYHSPALGKPSQEMIAQLTEPPLSGDAALAAYHEKLKHEDNALQKIQLMVGLTQVYRHQGHIDKAHETLQTALGLATSLGDTGSEVWLMLQRAHLYRDTRQPYQALEWYEKARALEEKRGAREGLGEVLRILGRLQQDLRQPELARAHFQHAQEIFHATSHPLLELDVLHSLAKLELEQGNPAAAERAFLKAITLAEQVRTQAGEGMLLQEDVFQRAQGPYTDYLQLLLGQGRAQEAFLAVQKTKAQHLLGLMATGKVRLNSPLTAPERQTEAEHRRRCDQLSEAMVREAATNVVGSKARYNALKQKLTRAEQELALFRDTLYARYPGLRQRRHTDLSLEKLNLPPDSALLEYVFIGERLQLFVVTRAATGKVRVDAPILPPSTDLESQIQALRTACTDPKRSWQASAKTLFQALLAPAWAHLRAKRQLLICPDGVLWDLPFATLLTPEGSPLLAHATLSFAPSATTWHATQLSRPRPIASPKLLVVANPQFDSEKRFEQGPPVPGQRPLVAPDRPIVAPDRPLIAPDRDLFLPRATRLVDLPGTQREAEGLRRLFPSATLYTRQQAQEATLKEKVPQFTWVHIASHAFFNDAAPLLSSVVLANPTAGSNEDGFLTARELFDLDLSRVELLVLSACNTARGETRNGEGVIGLVWALFAAGCSAQVLSQWSVDDASTADLMTTFYQGLARKKTKAEALRTAALQVRTTPRYAHPYYWAPFVLMGNCQ